MLVLVVEIVLFDVVVEGSVVDLDLDSFPAGRFTVVTVVVVVYGVDVVVVPVKVVVVVSVTEVVVVPVTVDLVVVVTVAVVVPVK